MPCCRRRASSALTTGRRISRNRAPRPKRLPALGLPPLPVCVRGLKRIGKDTRRGRPPSETPSEDLSRSYPIPLAMCTPRSRVVSVHAILSVPTAKPYELHAGFKALVRICRSARRIQKKAMTTIRSPQPGSEAARSASVTRRLTRFLC